MNDRNTEVLEQYELEIKAFRRGRGAWVCETDKGLKLLREYKGTVNAWNLKRRFSGHFGRAEAVLSISISEIRRANCSQRPETAAGMW